MEEWRRDLRSEAAETRILRGSLIDRNRCSANVMACLARLLILCRLLPAIRPLRAEFPNVERKKGLRRALGEPQTFLIVSATILLRLILSAAHLALGLVLAMPCCPARQRLKHGWQCLGQRFGIVAAEMQAAAFVA